MAAKVRKGVKIKWLFASVCASVCQKKFVCPFVGLHCGCVPPWRVPFHWKTAYSALRHFLPLFLLMLFLLFCYHCLNYQSSVCVLCGVGGWRSNFERVVVRQSNFHFRAQLQLICTTHSDNGFEFLSYPSPQHQATTLTCDEVLPNFTGSCN